MKTLLLVSSFPPEVRSQSTLMYELAVDLVSAGHEVTVVTGVPKRTLPNGAGERYKGRLYVREQMDGVDVLRLPVLPVPRRVPLLRATEHLFLAAEYGLGGLLKGRPQATLVYSPPLPLGLAAHLVRRIYGAPFIFNVQDIYPQTAVDLGLMRGRALIRMAEWMESSIYERASVITVHSEGNREALLEKGVPDDKLTVVPNWVDTDQIKPGNRLNGFRKSHDLGEGFVVTFAGIMGYAQGLDTVLDAAALVREQRDITFLMVGDGALREPLVKRAEEMNLTNTRFLPMQPPSEYAHLLAASDVGLVTLQSGIRTPVVPAKLLSIMAAGRPVIASVPPKGDTPRIVERAGCGVNTPPGDSRALADAILNLHLDQEAGREMGKKGRAYAEVHYSRRQCVSRYESLLTEVAARNGR